MVNQQHQEQPEAIAIGDRPVFGEVDLLLDPWFETRRSQENGTGGRAFDALADLVLEPVTAGQLPDIQPRADAGGAKLVRYPLDVGAFGRANAGILRSGEALGVLKPAPMKIQLLSGPSILPLGLLLLALAAGGMEDEFFKFLFSREQAA